MTKGVSIVMCCYNSQKLLPKTLAYIAQQEIEVNIDCEVIVINNNSTDNTYQVAIDIWEELGCQIPFKVIDEPRPGLMNARQCAFKNAQYDLILFCDDDNWLDSTYLKNAYELMQKHPQIGILGGCNIGAYEIEPPAWIATIAQTYAIGECDYPEGDITHTRGRVFGAGMVFRKSIWQQFYGEGAQSILTDRVGEQLTTGSDTEMCWMAKLAGYTLYFSPRLRLQHYMTAPRLTWAYCRRLQRGIGDSLAYLSVYEYVWARRQGTIQDSPKAHWRKLVLDNLRFLFKSPKQLYHFLYRDREGEYYFHNYEWQYGRLRALWRIRREYAQMIAQVERAFPTNSTDKAAM